MNDSRRWLRLGVPVAALVLLAAAAPDGEAGRAAKIVGLGVVPGTAHSFAWDVNGRGQVAGYSYNLSDSGEETSPRAFLWKKGTLKPLPAAGGDESLAYGLTRDGRTVVGEAETPDGNRHAALWRDGAVRDMGTLPGDESSYVSDISDDGRVIAGTSFTPEGVGRAVRWADGAIRRIGTLPGREQSDTWAVNSRRQIVGVAFNVAEDGSETDRQAWVWKHGELTALPGLVEGGHSLAANLNERGEVVGWAEAAGGSRRAVVWRKGRVRNLGTLGGRTDSEAYGIDSHGDVVGRAFDRDAAGEPVRSRAFLWRRGRMIDLNASIPGRLGWRLLGAYEINDRDQIVGEGEHHGARRAFLLRR
jgi:probable HAF family extracellular repeat protein